MLNSGIDFHYLCPRRKGVPIGPSPNELPGGSQSPKWVTPSMKFRLATSFNMLKFQSQLRYMEVKASADILGFPYNLAADAVGLIGLN